MYYVLDRDVVAEKKGFVIWRAEGWILPPPPPSPMNSWTEYMHYYYYYHIFLTHLFVN